jgi:hypothetical protein
MPPPPTATVATTPQAQAQAPAPPAGDRVEGAVQTVANDQVTLADGKNFKLASTTRIIRRQTITATDLQPGQFVAVTAKSQPPDGMLLASIVNIFPPGFNTNGSQFPMAGGNLMTNATIDKVDGTKFSVTWPNGGANVQLAPNADLGRLVNATPADLTPGTKVSALVADGVARSINLQ